MLFKICLSIMFISVVLIIIDKWLASKNPRKVSKKSASRLARGYSSKSK